MEWQLYELDTGELLRCPPKDESRRTADAPECLAELLSDQVVRVQPKPCACHGQTYVFRSHGVANGAGRRTRPKLVDVARLAEASTGTVSAVLNRPASVPEATRVRVELAAAELGYVAGGGSGEPAPHWRRNGFATWLFQPAVTGRYPGLQGGRKRPLCGLVWGPAPYRFALGADPGQPAWGTPGQDETRRHLVQVTPGGFGRGRRSGLAVPALPAEATQAVVIVFGRVVPMAPQVGADARRRRRRQ